MAGEHRQRFSRDRHLSILCDEKSPTAERSRDEGVEEAINREKQQEPARRRSADKNHRQAPVHFRRPGDNLIMDDDVSLRSVFRANDRNENGSVRISR
jgi:hypothetical protein